MCILVGKVKQTHTYMWKVRKQNKAGRAKRTAYRVKATAVQRKKKRSSKNDLFEKGFVKIRVICNRL